MTTAQGFSEAVHKPDGILIWDLPLRLFHWLLVLAVSMAAVTGFLLPVTWLQVHIIAGTAIGSLLLLRLAWGVFGSTYSRFGSLRLSKGEAIRHLRDIRDGVAIREAGHNALGVFMMVALLGLLALIVASGFIVLGGQFKQGPLKAFVSYDFGGIVRDLHNIMAIALLALVAAHVAGAVFESWRTRENLPLAMLTGRKRQEVMHELRPVAARPWLAAAAAGTVLAILVPAAAALMRLPPAGIGAVVADASWKEECGSCHMAFPPSLLPAESWRGLMATLADHFGEDASLDAEQAAGIMAYLVANSAETQDSLPANRFRRIDGLRPFEITATPFWKRMHGDIPPSVFASKPVGAKQNCAACHADAQTAMFAPQKISIPQETKP